MTRWKGEGARKLVEYKFFWMGCLKGIHEVGLLRVIVGRTVLNLISAYAPQAGRPMPEKEEFFTLFGKIVSEIDDGEKLLIGHVGAGVESFEGVHGGF